MLNKLIISVLSIVCSIILGFTASHFSETKGEQDTDHAATYISKSLQEELAASDLIIKGEVVEELPSVKRDAGITNTKVDLSYDVAPVKVKIDYVLSGDSTLKEITYLQRGSTHGGDNLKKGNAVFLMLNRTSDGLYWSYNYDDGVWLINKDGKIQSKSTAPVLKELKQLNADQLVEKIKKTIENKPIG